MTEIITGANAYFAWLGSQVANPDLGVLADGVIDYADYVATTYTAVQGQGWSYEHTEGVEVWHSGNPEVPDVWVEGSGMFNLDGSLFADIRFRDSEDLDATARGDAFDVSLDEVRDSNVALDSVRGVLKAEFAEFVTISADQVTRYYEEESREVHSDIGTLYRGDLDDTFGGTLAINQLIDDLHLDDGVQGKTVYIADARGADISSSGVGNFFDLGLVEGTFVDLDGVFQTMKAGGGDSHLGNHGYNNTLLGGDGDDSFHLHGSGFTIANGDDGADVFRVIANGESDPRTITLTGGDGADEFRLITDGPVDIIITDFEQGVDTMSVSVLDGQFVLSGDSFLNWFGEENTDGSVVAQYEDFSLTVFESQGMELIGSIQQSSNFDFM